jgi:putative peptide zinc metalloprotease protein
MTAPAFPATRPMLMPADWCPRLRTGVRLEITDGPTPRHVMYHPDTGAYAYVGAGAFALAPLLDGTRPFESLQASVRGAAPDTVPRLLAGLLGLDFLEPPVTAPHHAGPPVAPAARSWTRLDFSYGGSAPAAFAALRPLARALFSLPAAVLFVALMIAGAWALTSVADRVIFDATAMPSLKVALSTLTIMAELAVLHELAHALALTRFGGRVSRIGVRLTYLLPSLYCDLSDGYRLPGRWPRVAVALAGICVQLLTVAVCALALRAGQNTMPYELRQLLTQLLAINALLVIVNLIPFVRFDGYWALTAALDAPNLRARSLSGFHHLMARAIVGDRDEPGASSPSRWVILFGAACAFTPPLLLSTALVEWSLLLGAMGTAGAVLWATVLGALAVVLANAGRRTARALRRLSPRQRLRVAVTVSGGAAVAAALAWSVGASVQGLAHSLWAPFTHLPL